MAYSEALLRRFQRKNIESCQIDHVLGLVAGIMADSEVNEAEMKYLYAWLQKNIECCNEYPASLIFEELVEIFADGVVTDDERIAFEKLLNRLVPASSDWRESEGQSPGHTPSVPYDNNHIDVDFYGATFCFTGNFAFGSRGQCEDVTCEVVGAVQANVTMKLDYLIVGEFVSPLWMHESFGTKIRKAIKYRDEKNCSIIILPEEKWATSIKEFSE